jgi:outer membrane immunogenic protein
MTKMIAVAALLGIAASPATAADLVMPAPVAVPAIAEARSAYDWSGLYLGAAIGGANAHITATDITEPSGGFFTDLVPAGTEGFDFNSTALAGSVHAGAQYQWQQLVLGGEVSVGATGMNQTITSPYFPDSDTETGTIGAYATAVGRVGIAFDRFMLYAKGGYAGGEVGFKARDNQALVTYQQNSWQNGYALGAGLDYAVTDALTLGIDYTHLDLGSAEGTGPNVFDSGALGNNPESYRTSATADIVTARLSYKFAD